MFGYASRDPPEDMTRRGLSSASSPLTMLLLYELWALEYFVRGDDADVTDGLEVPLYSGTVCFVGSDMDKWTAKYIPMSPL